MNSDEHWNPKWIYEEKGEDLPKLSKQRRCAAFFWSNQVDAAADDKAEVKLDNGGGAQVQRRREEEEERRGQRKEKEGVLRPIYKDKEISDMRGNRGAQKMDV